MCLKIVVTTPKCEILEKYLLWKFRSSIRTADRVRLRVDFSNSLAKEPKEGTIHFTQ